MNRDPFPIFPTIRIPIPTRLRFAADVIEASKAVPPNASAMRQRRCFRLAMEKRRWKRLHRWLSGRTIR